MIKTLHIATVYVTLLLFIGRGFRIYILNKPLVSRWLKILPHINDTILLITGILLAIRVQQYPFVHQWLTVKIICLIAYIILGMMAMKWLRATKAGLISWVGAIAILLFMITVALNKQPAGLFY